MRFYCKLKQIEVLTINLTPIVFTFVLVELMSLLLVTDKNDNKTLFCY